MPASSPGRSGATLASGFSWNLLYQIFQATVNFAAMLVLVRILPPSEYGRASAVVGWLSLFNAFSGGHFAAQALQLPEGEEPDWSQHLGAVLWIQLGLFTLSQLTAGAFWFIPDYRPVAPLLHVAGVGLLFDGANQVGLMRLRRRLDFRRLQVVQGIGVFVNISSIVVLGVLGFGALAIVVGANVLTTLPFAIDLFFVQRFRPRPGFLRVDWTAYRAALQFGTQQSGSALLHAARSGLTAAVLPTVLGYHAMGLLNRAQGLYTMTVGRVTSALSEAAYPMLPRLAGQDEHKKQSTRYIQGLLWLALPPTLFLGVLGVTATRVFYGQRWGELDPLMWPAAVALCASVLSTASQSVLLSIGRLRLCFLLELTMTLGLLPALVWVMVSKSTLYYLWATALTQLLVALIALRAASASFEVGWLLSTVLPLSVLIPGLISVGWLDRWLAPFPAGLRLFAGSVAFLALLLSLSRLLFPRALSRLLSLLPLGDKIAARLRLTAFMPDD